MSLYVLIKYVHVLLAIVAVGANATYAVWVARVARAPLEAHRHVLAGVKTLDDRLANPAYVLLGITGLSMVAVGDLRLNTFWLAAGIVLWATALILGFFVYTPMFRAQIRALDEHGAVSSEYRTAAANARVLGILIAVIVLAIVFFMVTKPMVG